MPEDYQLKWFRRQETNDRETDDNGTDFLKTTLASLPHVHAMGMSIFDPVHSEKEHCCGRCELIHLLNGEMTLVTGADRWHAGKGDVLIMPPSTSHLDIFDHERGLRAFMVFFMWEGAEEFFRVVSNERLLHISESRRAEAARVFDDMRVDFSGDESFDRLGACVRMHMALTVLYRGVIETMKNRSGAESETQGARHRSKLFAEARRFLEEHMAEPVTLDGIAGALGVSPFYLSHVFSEESSFSLFAYLTMLRMNKARELLKAGELNVSEVAHRVGYESSNAFSKAFRRQFGKPPRDFLYQGNG